jgi:cytochrome c
MVQTANELLEAITPIDDPEVHAFVEYLEWMKSYDDVDSPDDEEPGNDLTPDPADSNSE